LLRIAIAAKNFYEPNFDILPDMRKLARLLPSNQDFCTSGCLYGSMIEKFCDTVTGGIMLASGAQPPVSVTHIFSPVGEKLLSQTNRVKYKAAHCLKRGKR
jgi:hypothetical protein